MASSSRSPVDGTPRGGAPVRSDRSPWNWLLLVPIVVPLLVPLYNHLEPTLFGWPLFYWLQLSFVVVGVAATSTVYLVTRRSRGEREAGQRAAAGQPTSTDGHGGAHR